MRIIPITMFLNISNKMTLKLQVLVYHIIEQLAIRFPSTIFHRRVRVGQQLLFTSLPPTHPNIPIIGKNGCFIDGMLHAPYNAFALLYCALKEIWEDGIW